MSRVVLGPCILSLRSCVCGAYEPFESQRQDVATKTPNQDSLERTMLPLSLFSGGKNNS